MSDSWIKMCRLCLNEASCLLSIHQNWCGLDLKQNIHELYCLEIFENDGLPQKICMSCVTKIKSFGKEKEFFLDNQNLLKAIRDQKNGISFDAEAIGSSEPEPVELSEDAVVNENESMNSDDNNGYVKFEELIEETIQIHENEDLISVDGLSEHQDDDQDDLIEQDIREEESDYSVSETTNDLGTQVSNNYVFVYTDDDCEEASQIITESHTDEQSNFEVLEEEIIEDQSGMFINDYESDSSDKEYLTHSNVFENSDYGNEDYEDFNELNEKKKRIRKKPTLPDNLPRLSDYKCYVCSLPKRFETDILLTEHLTSHKDLLPFTCNDCTMEKVVIKELRKLNNHIRMHAQPLKCDFCDKRYSCRKTVNDHMKTIHLEKPEPIKCPECSKICGDRAKLNKHMVLHTDKFKCKECAKTFVTITMLRRHELQHKSWEDRPSLSCFICGNNYVNKETLELHLATHNQIKHHQCETCSEKFMRISDLNRHAKLHLSENYKKKRSWKDQYTVQIDEKTQEKKYKCNTCDNVSSNASNIRSHVLGHIRPYKCTFCEESFNDLVAQKDHENKHTGAKTRQCRFCDKKFAHTSTLYFHHKTHPEFNEEKQHIRQQKLKSKSNK